MKRSNFLKILGIGAAATVVAPLAIAEILKPEEVPYGIKVAKDVEFEWRMKGAEPRMVWVDDGDSRMWYTVEQLEARRQFDREMNLKLLQHWGDHSLSDFLHKTGSSI